MSSATIEGVESFNAIIGAIVNIAGPGSNAAGAFRDEVGHLIEACANHTPQASQKKIRQRADFRFSEKYAIRGSGDLKVTMNDGSRRGETVAENVWLRSGDKWHIMRGPGRWPASGATYKRGPRKGQPTPSGQRSRFSPDGAHWPDRIWNEYQGLINQTDGDRAALKKQFIARALLSQGLVRQSWLQIAEDLGLNLSGDFEKARRAVASDGSSYRNGTGTHTATSTETTYTLVNTMPALAGGRNKLDGHGILESALAAREAAFDIAVEKGLYRDIEHLSRHYPGLLSLTN